VIDLENCYEIGSDRYVLIHSRQHHYDRWGEGMVTSST